ncbi:hypothetical protein C5F48_23930 [Cereibacter changlensis JA139]|uniref:Uncharacterized protein n=1 Tax=Cereibacter changlensis JA139 TaxID=1188249 RepID=A0A2T4JJD9_9RHOB|nr:hypothetical protein C5F48_23930 [Cereibacter changlensis JA139]
MGTDRPEGGHVETRGDLHETDPDPDRRRHGACPVHRPARRRTGRATLRRRGRSLRRSGRRRHAGGAGCSSRCPKGRSRLPRARRWRSPARATARPSPPRR